MVQSEHFRLVTAGQNLLGQAVGGLQWWSATYRKHHFWSLLFIFCRLALTFSMNKCAKFQEDQIKNKENRSGGEIDHCEKIKPDNLTKNGPIRSTIFLPHLSGGLLMGPILPYLTKNTYCDQKK